MHVFVKSFGCSANLADGEVLAGCLAETGYELVESIAEADVVIYNTCAVKGPTENRMIETLKRVPEDKKLIVAGCLPLINFERLRREVCFHGAIGPAFSDKIVDVVKRVLNDEPVVALEGAAKTKPSLDLPRLRLNPVIGIVPISYGCLGACAYCCVVFARGHLRSYSIQEIVNRVREDLSAGVREFWFTSQDTGCYGRDIGKNLAELLNTVCRIEEDFRIRVGMMTPNMAENILEELIQAFKSERVFKFIHLPVQSGDDHVLKCMRRFYSADDFKRVVRGFRTSFPDITVATDVICGFPGETEEAFKNTLHLIEEVKPDIVNVSKFFARPRTVAAGMQKESLSPREVKHRSGVTAELARKVTIERSRRWVDWTGEVLIDEVGKVSGSWVGRNFAYKPVAVKTDGSEDLLGRIINTMVVKAFPTYLKAEIVQ
jgi:threonylcarbamoyladenosine tRNA methylthiotransferase CDKAL1